MSIKVIPLSYTTKPQITDALPDSKRENGKKTAEKHYVGRNENEASDNRWSAGEAVTVISGCPRNGIREEREAEGGL